jgi:hypothetical protein
MIFRYGISTAQTQDNDLVVAGGRERRGGEGRGGAEEGVIAMTGTSHHLFYSFLYTWLC